MKTFWNFIEATISDLAKGTGEYEQEQDTSRPKVKRAESAASLSPSVKPGHIQVRVLPKQQTIFFGFWIQGSSDNYMVELEFNDVKFVKAEDIFLQSIMMQPEFQKAKEMAKEYGNLTIVVDTQTKEKYIIHPISHAYANVKVHCDCPDFNYTFHLHNFKGGSAARPREDLTHPKRAKSDQLINPNGKQGMCKHIIACLNLLQSRGVVTI